MAAFFIVVSPADCRSYVHQADREFFSVPVQVEPSHCEISTRLMYVTSPLQGGVSYPVEARNLKAEHRLTNRQRASARRIQ